MVFYSGKEIYIKEIIYTVHHDLDCKMDGIKFN